MSLPGLNSAQLTLFAEAFPASPSPWQDSELRRTILVGSGRRWLGLSLPSGPVGWWLRTCLDYSGWDLTRYALIWRLSVTPSGRWVFRLSRSARLTSGSDCGLWHTPNVPNGGRVNGPEMGPTGLLPSGRKRQVGLNHQVRMAEAALWPTPRCAQASYYVEREATMMARGRAARQTLPTAAAAGEETIGQLNPEWVEWLMGFPPGWTDCEPSETP